MANDDHIVLQTLRRFWSAVYGPRQPAIPEVVVHDPAAQKAHDLDDPYFDDKVQARMADVIAGAQKK